jgi:hypothetical protein
MTIGRIPSVEGGIQPTIVDAKGDLIAATAADSVNRLAVGSNDQVLVADSSASTGLAWKSYGAQFVAGKNKIINGDFSVNQRNFTITSVNQNNVYTFDRWVTGIVPGTGTVYMSAQTFTPGSAPVSGYESTNYFRIESTGVVAGGTTTTQIRIGQRIEDVRTLAGQTAVVSFWAKAASGTPNIGVRVDQSFGSGGSSTVSTLAGSVTAITTSWARYSFTVSVPSISGKTLGAGSFLDIRLFVSAGSAITEVSAVGLQDNTFDIWGVQVEAGSVATPFTTATGTIQGELAACQRYYYVLADAASQNFGTCAYYSATDVLGSVFFPVTMRTAPTFSAASGSYYEVVRNSAADALSGLQSNLISTRTANIFADSGNGASGTAGHAGQYRTTSASANIAFSAEL